MNIRSPLAAVLLIVGFGLGASWSGTRAERRHGPGRSGNVVPTSPIHSIEDYSEAEEQWRKRTHDTALGVTVGGLLLTCFAFILDNVAAGPKPFPQTTSATLAMIERTLDSMIHLSQGQGVAVSLALLGAQAALAIALSTTKIEPDLTTYVALETERWIRVLAGSVLLLACGVSFIAVGCIAGIFRAHSAPAGTVIVTVLAVVSTVLASAMIDRRGALVVQVGIRAQMERLNAALDRLDPVPGSGSAKVLWAGLVPAGVVLELVVVLGRDDTALDETVRQMLAGFALVGAVGFFQAWSRRGFESVAMSWARESRWPNARLLLGSIAIVAAFVVIWGAFVLLLALVLGAGNWFFVIGIFVSLMTPAASLAFVGSPRIRRCPDGSTSLRPSQLIARGAGGRLRRSRERLQESLAREERRTAAGIEQAT